MTTTTATNSAAASETTTQPTPRHMALSLSVIGRGDPMAYRRRRAHPMGFDRHRRMIELPPTKPRNPRGRASWASRMRFCHSSRVIASRFARFAPHALQMFPCRDRPAPQFGQTRNATCVDPIAPRSSLRSWLGEGMRSAPDKTLVVQRGVAATARALRCPRESPLGLSGKQWRSCWPRGSAGRCGWFSIASA